MLLPIIFEKLWIPKSEISLQLHKIKKMKQKDLKLRVEFKCEALKFLQPFSSFFYQKYESYIRNMSKNFRILEGNKFCKLFKNKKGSTFQIQELSNPDCTGIY